MFYGLAQLGGNPEVRAGAGAPVTLRPGAAFPKPARPWGPKSRRLHCDSLRGVTLIHNLRQPGREGGVHSLPLSGSCPRCAPQPPAPARSVRGPRGRGAWSGHPLSEGPFSTVT